MSQLACQPWNTPETASHGNRIIWYYRDRLSQPVKPALFDPHYWQQGNNADGQAQGRGTAWFVRDGQQDMVLRHYYRGGLVGRLLKDCFVFTGLARSRSYAELRLLEIMGQAGLPVPRPVAAQLQRCGLGYRADLLIERIAGATDLGVLLKQRSVAQELYVRIGKTIADFHNQQVYHSDLNINNILVDGDDSIWLIDFDKGQVRTGQRWKAANLQRLLRSFNKQNEDGGLHWQADDWHALLSGYQSRTAHPLSQPPH